MKKSITPFLLLALAACAAPQPKRVALQKDELSAHLIATHDFMGIFENRLILAEDEQGPYQLDKPVSDFIMSCCRTADAAVRLLRQNGFIVTEIANKKNYDKAYHAERLSRKTNIATAVQYHVALYIKDNTVEDVAATAFQDLK